MQAGTAAAGAAAGDGAGGGSAAADNAWQGESGTTTSSCTLQWVP
jgi:hypothetical protein